MSRKIRRAPVWVPSGVCMHGVHRALATPLLLAPIAAAGVLGPAPGPSVRLASAVGHCGSNAGCFFDADFGWPGCSGPKVIIDDCPAPDEPPSTEVTSLDLLTRVESRHAVGVLEVDNLPLSIVHAVDPAAQAPILRSMVAAERGTDSVRVEFDLSRRTIESLVEGSQPVLEAWPVGGEAGIAVLGELDQLQAEVDIELAVTTTLRLDTMIASADVRTNQYPWRSEIAWQIRSSSNVLVAACEASVSVPDQALSLEIDRTPVVSPRDESQWIVTLEPGTYRLIVDHLRSPLRPLAWMNGCHITFGRWAQQDEASLTVSIALPADIDRSGTVDYGDVAFALLDYGNCGEPCLSDIDGSGTVDSGDVALVLLDYGMEVPPETACPST